MKTAVAWTIILWAALVLENARPALFPTCSLVLPFAVGCLFWIRSGHGILIGGSALILRWVLQPTQLPLEAVVVLVLASWLLTRNQKQQTWSPAASPSKQHHWWLHPTMVLVLALLAHLLLESGFDVNDAFVNLPFRSMIMLPCLACCVIASYLADEFGLRRRTSPSL